MKCVNEECDKDPLNNPDRVIWGCDGDYCCNQECYEKAQQQMDYFCGNILQSDARFATWLGVPEEWISQ